MMQKDLVKTKTSLKLALIGYGKMGKAIEAVALERGHQVLLKINSENRHKLTKNAISEVDIVIEFTNPEHAYENISFCLKAGVPVVSGSTGWLSDWPRAVKLVDEHHASLLYASNFSVGVNIFFEVNKRLASLMSLHPEYDVHLEEIHHTAKKDAPSGTAITLAEQILLDISRKKSWTIAENSVSTDLLIKSVREDPAPGTHKIHYTSDIDDIEIIHTAHNRKGFATGVLLAAEFLHGKKGIYSMKDVLNL